MSDKLPFFAAESGTWKTTSPNPHIDLSGTALTLGTYPVQTFKAAADDTTLDFASTNTCAIVAWVDATNWKRYEGAVWTDATPDTLDLSAATLMGAAGTISADAAVSVVASLPSVVADGSITLAKLANLAQDQFIGRTTASTGVPQTATITAAARTVLDDTSVSAMVDTLGGASAAGTGGLVRATSPTLVTPLLGTPTSGTLTNCLGYPETMMLFAGNPVSPMFVGTAKVTWPQPFAMTVTAVSALVTTAPTGTTIIFDINEAGTSILSTKLSIDISETSSSTAATPAVISDASLAAGAVMTIDIDQVGSTVAGVGPVILIHGYRV